MHDTTVTHQILDNCIIELGVDILLILTLVCDAGELAPNSLTVARNVLSAQPIMQKIIIL